MQNDACIVSFAKFGRENYNKAQLRLCESISRLWKGDTIIRSFDGYCDSYAGIPILLGTYPAGYKYNHDEVPYAFKVDIIKEAIDKGYKKIIWCDSTILLHQNLQPMLDYAAQWGVTAFNNIGHPLWHWISDIALQKQGFNDSQLYAMPQIMACAIVIDISNKTGKTVFDEWYAASRDGVSFQNSGSNRDGFKSHRHDQAVLSLLLYKHNIPLLPYGNLVYHPHEVEPTDYKNIYFVNKGLQ